MAVSIQETIEILKKTYDDAYCDALELAYGDNMMAEGGSEGVDRLFQGVELEGRRALDFGCGLGGVAFHLARTHDMSVVGLDINELVIQRARKNTPADLVDKIEFVLNSEEIDLPFESESFDVVYSKGVMVHLAIDQKEQVLKEFYRVLKRGGVLVIGDWMSPKDQVWSSRMQRLIEGEHLPLFAIAPSTYKLLLLEAGFIDVVYTDRSEAAAQYNMDVAERLTTEPIRSRFVHQFGPEELAVHVEGYKNIAASNESGELITGKLAARKA